MEQITNATSNNLIELNVLGLQNGMKNLFLTYFWDKMWTSFVTRSAISFVIKRMILHSQTQGYTEKELLSFYLKKVLPFQTVSQITSNNKAEQRSS